MPNNDDEELFFQNSKYKFLINETSKLEDIKGSKEFNSEINNIIEHKDNIVVLSGAGTSVLKNEEGEYIAGKTMKALTEIINSELKEKWGVSISAINENFSLTSEQKKEDIDLENLLSKLILFRDHFEKFEEELNLFPDVNSNEAINSAVKLDEVIKLMLENILDETTSYHIGDKGLDFKHKEFIKKLSSLIDYSKGRRLSIVTTNYDTLFEEAAEEIKYTVVDGFSYSYKPEFNSDMFNWDFTRPIENVSSNEIEYNPNVINLLKIHGSVNWINEGEKIKRLNEKISKKQLDSSVMIFPSSEKYMETYKEPYFNLIVKFQELLRQPNTLLITSGFSFSDNHIAEMVIQAIKKNNSLVVLVTDFKIAQENNSKKLKEFGGLSKLMETYPVSFLKASFNNDLLELIFGKKDE